MHYFGRIKISTDYNQTRANNTFYMIELQGPSNDFIQVSLARENPPLNFIIFRAGEGVRVRSYRLLFAGISSHSK